MRYIRAVVLALSTYTRIPVPQVKWDGDAMRLAIAFLPLCGAIVGAAVWLWVMICRAFGLSPVTFAAVTLVLPIFITGGIHMDGYCDTSDALASWRDMDKLLEILKDPRAGAFAVIRYGMYLLISFAVTYELYLRGKETGILAVYMLSRCAAALSAMSMPNARKDGMLAAFTEKADKLAAVVILSAFGVIAVALYIWLSPAYGLCGAALLIILTFWYRRTATKRFGGVTGDTTGYYLQLCELTLISGSLLGTMIGGAA